MRLGHGGRAAVKVGWVGLECHKRLTRFDWLQAIDVNLTEVVGEVGGPEVEVKLGCLVIVLIVR